jgi:O-antigen/teichoic acid export membrane protein
MVTIKIWSRSSKLLKSILSDALYRGSFTLLVNTVIMSAFGFAFWTLAAHAYPASTIGVFSGLTSGVSLLATVAGLGLPITIMRHVADSKNPRALFLVTMIAIATVGTAVCLVTVLSLGPHLPATLHLQQRGRMMLFITALVGFTAISSTIDSGLVAIRSSHTVLIKNLIGSVAKVATLLLLASFRSSGLLISYSIGLVLSTLISGTALGSQLEGRSAGFRSFQVLRTHLSFTSGTYIATIMGMLPLTVVPLEVLVVRGATETARFAVAFLIAGFLNLIPSTVAQVLFAETSRKGVPLGRQLTKAIRGVYGLLIPALLIALAGAPLLLRLFGSQYSIAATGCLRVLALSTLFTGGTYLVDSLLVARDRTGAYIFMNAANAVLVLGCVGFLLPRGLTAAAGGWALGQGTSLVLGLLTLTVGRSGKHHPRENSGPPAGAVQTSQRDLEPRHAIDLVEPQIRELLATWPMMPTTLIAENIGWNESLQMLFDLVTELRYPHPHPQDLGRSKYQPGEVVQCGLWFPPVEIPVGFGQIRSASQLPVLTMITGYSRWLTATLIPSRHTKDILAGSWELLTILGAVPRVMTWDADSAVCRSESGRILLSDECAGFFDALGTKLVIGRSADPHTRSLIEEAQAHLERSFLSGRVFTSPEDFNTQLRTWLKMRNTFQRRPPELPPAELIDIDKRAMLPLPPVPPPSGWHLALEVGNYPFFRFESNDYSLHPGAAGRRVELIADLHHIRVLCDGKLAAKHSRSWAGAQTIQDPAHAAAVRAPTVRRLNGYNSHSK